MHCAGCPDQAKWHRFSYEGGNYVSDCGIREIAYVGMFKVRGADMEFNKCRRWDNIEKLHLMNAPDALVLPFSEEEQWVFLELIGQHWDWEIVERQSIEDLVAPKAIAAPKPKP